RPVAFVPPALSLPASVTTRQSICANACTPLPRSSTMRKMIRDDSSTTRFSLEGERAELPSFTFSIAILIWPLIETLDCANAPPGNASTLATATTSVRRFMRNLPYNLRTPESDGTPVVLTRDRPFMHSWQIIEHGKPLQKVVNETPKPKGTEVLVRVTRSGVCHSDLHIWDGYFDWGGGKRFYVKDRGCVPPFTLGHEPFGVV